MTQGGDRQGFDVSYDEAGQLQVKETAAADPDQARDATALAGGCSSGSTLLQAARDAGKSEILDQYAEDYPQGPHDKPQSMCPAFGSLRVGLRMKRTATILSGSACCVYGLTFVSHFYGARRSVGYVPFNSETLVTGKLFEDIREAVHDIADPEKLDAVVVTNLRKEIEAGPVAMPASGKSDRPTVSLLGEMFPADPMMIGQMLAPLGLAAGPVVPCREWRELYGALDCGAVAAIHPFYTASVREFQAAGRPVIGSAPVGNDGTHAWLAAIGEAFNLPAEKVAAAQNQFLPLIRDALYDSPINGTITLSGYEGSELLVARLLIESGADVPYVGTACAKSPWSAADAAWLEDKGVKVKFRASLEDDCAAMEAVKPDLAIGTTPVVQKGKELGIPALYFTNLISARPLMGVAGAGSLQQVVNAAIGNKDRMHKMQSFFEGVGREDTAGVWEADPNVQPQFRAQNLKKLEKQARAAKAAEMI